MINSAVLVLNRYYQPVHVTSVKRAFSLLYQGVAKAIDAQYRLYEFDDWAALSATNDCITTINRTIRVPRVLVLSAYDHLPRGRVRFSRLNIYARDADTCQYCGKNLPRSELNLDHVMPRTQGGKTTWENVVCSCVPCNLKKGGRTPEQADMRLLKKPVRPRWTPLFRGATRKVTYQEWLPFLHLADASYWNVELLDE
ncbi:HNH endonuclease [Myxococcus sp. MISCRS1]|jgi:5-methylcytosine-specific restriction endonuclease McrA|uniref:Restriction endonuclease n=3 Tax=Myxococcus TaxID=32 RepID=A0A511TDY1_MYXFU|nr:MULTISPECIES: HNH endonuclease [Myxococcus]AKF82006.1 HNH endonuclease [Myxococcus fulvus 124B02]BDT35170.1 HNH endonuclease [Myxococcus sp. MH1]AGC45878.1 HNH endonuclease domain-containing protein [Myxococcus stipitatus DSM 14675]MBZ4398236.1 HNH endonuclease [Myxococcus sp. AS-1-15]MBZ4409078.1 HNH endonuclease [Myxococcus sp. XM-1-1-1]